MDIKQLRTRLELSQQELSNETGISKAKIEKWETKKANPKVADYEILKNFFFSHGVLEESVGHPLKTLDIETFGKNVSANMPEGFSSWAGVPMFNKAVSASFIEHYTDELFYQPEFYLRDTRFRDCSFGAIITGDSMHGEIRHGDRVICKEVKNFRSLVYGDIYYLVTEELDTCKYLHPAIKEIRAGAIRKKDGSYLDADVVYDEDKLLLVAHNASVPSSPVYKEDIIKLYKVKGVLRGY